MRIDNRGIWITELPKGVSVEVQGETCQLFLDSGEGFERFQAQELAELIEALQTAHRSMTGTPAVSTYRTIRVLHAGDPEPEIGFRGHDKDGDKVERLASGHWRRNGDDSHSWHGIVSYAPITEEI